METLKSFPLVASLVARSGFMVASAKLMMGCKSAYNDDELLDITMDTQIGSLRRTRIHTACASGNLVRLHQILYVTDIEGVHRLRHGIAKALDVEDLVSHTAMELALESGHGDMVDALVRAGANPLHEFRGRGFVPWTRTPLCLAARYAYREGGAEIFTQLLDAAEARVAAGLHGAGVPSVSRDHLMTALQDACVEPLRRAEWQNDGLFRQRHCIATLLGRLSALGAIDGSCVAVVASFGHVDPLAFVLNCADPLASHRGLPWSHPEPALSAAARHKDLSCLAVLLGRYQSLIMSAANDDRGMAFTQVSLDGELCLAIETVCTERANDAQPLAAKLAAVEMLLSRIGDVGHLYDEEVHDESRPNALHHTAQWSAELTQLLLSRLAGRDALGQMLMHEAYITRLGGQAMLSPLGTAVQASSPAVGLMLDVTAAAMGLDAYLAKVQLLNEAAVANATRLVAAGAHPATAGSSGTSPLVAAARIGDVPLLEYFFTLLTPPQVAAGDDNGHTALGAAASSGFAQCLRHVLAFLRTGLPAAEVQRLLADAFVDCVDPQVEEEDHDEYELDWHSDQLEGPFASEDERRRAFHSSILGRSDDDIRLGGEQWARRCWRGVASLAQEGLTAADVKHEPSHRDAVSTLARMIRQAAQRGLPNVTHILAAALKCVTHEGEYAAYLAAAARDAMAAVEGLSPADAEMAGDFGRAVSALACRVTGGVSALTIDGAPGGGRHDTHPADT